MKEKALRTSKQKVSANPARKGGRVDTTALAKAADNAVEQADVKKTKEFKMFFIWHSMPSVFIGKGEAYLRGIGINDPDALKLLSIKTQSEFAQEYGVRDATLSEWKQKINKRGLDEDTRDFFKGLTKNILAAFYHKTLEHADAQRVRLWLEEFAGKKPEGSTPPIPAMLGPQFNTVIIQLREKYNSDLRSEYERIIREKGGEVSGSERVRTDPSPRESEEGGDRHRDSGDSEGEAR